MSENKKYESLDKNFELIKKYEKAKGSAVILDKDKVVYSNYFGLEKIEGPIYRIGSISKIYTAVIILKLIEDGLLSLDTKLSTFYSEIDQAEKISIEHLLKHRSGLPNLTSQEDYLSYYEGPVTESEHLARFKTYKLEFEPGEKYDYSNTGYVLLTFIAEKLASRSYNDLLNQYIVGPLKLKDTYVYSKQKPNPREVKSYKSSGKGWAESSSTHESVPLGAGAIASTPKEVAIFLRSIFKENLISKSSLEKMLEFQDEYGLGIFSVPYGDKKFYGHTGGIDSFASIAGHNREDDVTVVQLTNGMETSFNGITISLLASYYGDSVEILEFKERVEVPVETLDLYVGNYSGEEFPLKLNFRHEDGVLIGRASGEGQSDIFFNATSLQDFEFSYLSIKLKFSADGKELDFSQGQSFLLKKD